MGISGARFKQILFEVLLRHPGGNVKEVIIQTSLDFRARGKILGVFIIHMIFKGVRLYEIT